MVLCYKYLLVGRFPKNYNPFGGVIPLVWRSLLLRPWRRRRLTARVVVVTLPFTRMIAIVVVEVEIASTRCKAKCWGSRVRRSGDSFDALEGRVLGFEG